jgi:dihydrodipicolinate synthase/N-acetylneuraminate lyase
MNAKNSSLPPLRGVVPILVTPFDDAEQIDLDAVAAEAAFLAEAGVRWVGIGFGSEVQRLTANEIVRLVDTVRKGDSRLRVVGNVDATSIAGARETIQRLEQSGADAVLVRPPALSGLDAAGIADAFQRVAEGSPLAVIVQDAAEMTGSALTVDMIARLLTETPSIVAAKIESRDAALKISAIRERLGGTRATLLGGSGGAGYALELVRGVDGTMPGPAFPELFLALEAAHRRGDLAKARHIQTLLLPHIQIGNRGMDTFIYTQKHALRRRGVLSSARLRRPHSLPADPLLDVELDVLLDDLEQQAAT